MSSSRGAFKPLYAHIALEKKIGELSPLSRSEFANLAFKVAASINDDKIWLRLFEEVASLPKTGDLPVPSAIQIRLDEQAMNYYNLLYINAHQALYKHHKLKHLRKQFFVLLIWQNYYNYLKEESLNVGKTSETSITSEMSAPDMFHILAEIVLLNRAQECETIAEIKAILQRWKDKNT